MNAKMKTLSLAVLGLVGIGAAGSAMAVCPANPFAAWAGGAPTALFGGNVAGIAPGMISTACKMAANFDNTATSNGAAAQVSDNTPANETTYRFRFYVDRTNVTAGLGGTTTVNLFTANSAASTNGTSRIARVVLRGAAGSVFVRLFGACTSGDNFTVNTCRAATDVALPAGETRVEGQVIMGGTGTGKINLWVGTNVNPATPDTTVNVNNSAWIGVKQATLGLSGSSSDFRATYPNQNVFFDEFDSRRQTFIGN